MSSMYVDGKINEPDKVDKVVKSRRSDGVSPNVRYIVRSVFAFVLYVILLRVVLVLLGLTFLVACSSCSRKVILHGTGLHADSLYYETENVLKMREK